MGGGLFLEVFFGQNTGRANPTLLRHSTCAKTNSGGKGIGEKKQPIGGKGAGFLSVCGERAQSLHSRLLA